MDNARVVEVNGKPRKMIGTLLITPDTGDGKIEVVPIPVNPNTVTLTPTPTVMPTATWIG